MELVFSYNKLSASVSSMSTMAVPPHARFVSLPFIKCAQAQLGDIDLRREKKMLRNYQSVGADSVRFLPKQEGVLDTPNSVELRIQQ